MAYTFDQCWEVQQKLFRCSEACPVCGHPLADHDLQGEETPLPLWCRHAGCERCRRDWGAR